MTLGAPTVVNYATSFICKTIHHRDAWAAQTQRYEAQITITGKAARTYSTLANTVVRLGGIIHHKYINTARKSAFN
jgi:hypothetical protein